ncbi:LacI family DNA-binding transcriptional regulator [Thioclava sp. FTW29]|uniref:LacI family DNA-binding transcriptional regulator n=1 Tax=Thioclava litoralis TaxID=3076557 RepID=A0ABZ1E4S8_9RHOB|nr:LacI family DNA-binding transcriptional regulator [Thioclava sp. FTW29]
MKKDPAPQPAESYVTADDVARAAGVSRWTVNRAFRKDASISEKAREKVLQAAAALDYIPDLRAAALASARSSSARSNLVALLIDDFANPHKLVMLEHLTRALRRGGWDILLVNTLDTDDTAPALRHASQRRVDATILIGIQFHDDILNAVQQGGRQPKLIVFARTSQNENVISIAVDDRAATLKIAQYITQKGFRKPFYLAGPRTFSAHLLRKETFMEYWADTYGSQPETQWVDAYDSQKAERLIRQSLTGRAPQDLPDVIVCENDALALGTIDAIRHDLKLRVPEDIAVIGFDDVPQAASPNYRLTTYQQPLGDMAAYLVEVLDSRSPLSSKTFLGQLIIRETA